MPLISISLMTALFPHMEACTRAHETMNSPSQAGTQSIAWPADRTVWSHWRVSGLPAARVLLSAIYTKAAKYQAEPHKMSIDLHANHICSQGVFVPRLPANMPSLLFHSSELADREWRAVIFPG